MPPILKSVRRKSNYFNHIDLSYKHWRFFGSSPLWLKVLSSVNLPQMVEVTDMIRDYYRSGLWLPKDRLSGFLTFGRMKWVVKCNYWWPLFIKRCKIRCQYKYIERLPARIVVLFPHEMNVAVCVTQIVC